VGGTIWSIAVIVGPIILAGVMLFAVLTNRRRSAAERERTERGSKALYEQLDREDKARHEQDR
jgi:uncharacterized membrane protein YqiK